MKQYITMVCLLMLCGVIKSTRIFLFEINDPSITYSIEYFVEPIPNIALNPINTNVQYDQTLKLLNLTLTPNLIEKNLA